MKKSRTHHKSNSKKIVIGAIISFVLLLSIIATIILKNKAVQDDSQGKEVEQSQEQPTEDQKPVPLEDPLEEQPTEQQPTEQQPTEGQPTENNLINTGPNITRDTFLSTNAMIYIPEASHPK